MTVYKHDECPLCKQGVAVNTRVGHGKDFIAKQAAQGIIVKDADV
jgi:hypothetical protein